MKVLILGAAGGLGRCLLSQALNRGHEVTSLIRGEPSRLGVVHDRLRILTGDALDPAAIDAAVQGQDAVIFSLGEARKGKPTTLFSDAARILIPAMETHGVRRLLCVTGIGAGDSKGHGGFIYDRIVFPLFTKHVYRDKDRQEELIRQSRLDWVIIRPASFTNGRLRGNLRVAVNLDGVTMQLISRADAASFILDQLTSDEYLRKTPLIGY
jgi:putative NADH-flavin reductase